MADSVLGVSTSQLFISGLLGTGGMEGGAGGEQEPQRSRGFELVLINSGAN